MSNPNPIFIIGNPRSGTTMLRLALACHRNICVPPECGFVVWLHQFFEQWTTVQSVELEQLNRFVAELMQCRKFETWDLDAKTILEGLQKSAPQCYSQLCACVYDIYRQKNKPSAKRWGDKNNFHVQHVDLIAALYPQAMFLHIVRDGRDVACSYRELSSLDSKSPYSPSLPADIGQIALEWSSNTRHVINSFSKLDGPQVIHVRYEDIVSDPRQWFERICCFLTEDFDPGMLEFYNQDLEPEKTMDWKRLTKSPITNSRVNRFKIELDNEAIGTFESIAEKELKFFGYMK